MIKIEVSHVHEFGSIETLILSFKLYNELIKKDMFVSEMTNSKTLNGLNEKYKKIKK